MCIPEVETTYIDRWRHRLPHFQTQTGMKEHMDNGGMSRWADPAWQHVSRVVSLLGALAARRFGCRVVRLCGCAVVQLGCAPSRV
eukprot:3117531-Rhodomonas_salina.1